MGATKLKERSGNVYENKGTRFYIGQLCLYVVHNKRLSCEYGNVIENKGDTLTCMPRCARDRDRLSLTAESLSLPAMARPQPATGR